MAESSTNTSTKPAPKKRSLFTKPSWSKPENLESPTDLFHRANHTYVDLAAEVERKRKVKIARKGRERARQEGSQKPAKKRICLSDESEDDDDDQSSNDGDQKKLENKKVQAVETESRLNSTAKQAGPVEPKSSPRSLSKRYEAVVAAPKIARKEDLYPSTIIDLDDEDDSEQVRPEHKDDQDDDFQVTTIRPSKPPEPDDEPASDEEFPDLARKAREKARRKRLEAEMEHATADPPSADEIRHSRRSHSVQHPTPPPPLDAVVQIFITSRIPNTDPLIVSRKISQRLKDVRVAWCQRQGFSQDFMNKVFLAWRGKRLFDVTTCKSLGIAVDQDGNILMKGQRDILGEEDRQVHMEAMTEEILEEYKKEKRHAAGEEEAEDHDKEAEVAEQPKQEAQVRIILKAKGLDDFKLIVKPVSYIFRYQKPRSFADPCRLPSSQRFSMLFGPQTKLAQIKRSSFSSTETALNLIVGWGTLSSATWMRLTSTLDELCILAYRY